MNPSRPRSSAKNRRTNPRHEDSAAGSATAGPERSTRDITVGLSSVAIEECGDYRMRVLCSCSLPAHSSSSAARHFACQSFPPRNTATLATRLPFPDFLLRVVRGPRHQNLSVDVFYSRRSAMKVREIMTPNPRTAEPDTTLEEIATIMKDEDVGVVPVVENGRVIGLVTARDIVVRCIAGGKDATECVAEDVMSEDVRTVESDADVDDAADIMGDEQIRRLPVVRNGKLVGMLSLGDIAVKAEDEDETTAETLEEVSQGVRGSRGSRQAGSNGQDRSQQ